jgi:hypothetical protein
VSFQSSSVFSPPGFSHFLVGFCSLFIPERIGLHQAVR